MGKLAVSERWKEYYQKYGWPQILESTARKYPDKEALVFGDTRVTYQEYYDKVNAWAKGLYAVGVRKNTHVGLWMTNRPEWCFARLAIYKLGAVMIPLHTRYRAEELKFVLHQGDVAVLIMEDRFLGKIDAISVLGGLVPGFELFEPGKIASEEFPLLKTVVCLGKERFGQQLKCEEMIERGKDVPLEGLIPSFNMQDTIHISYTSGTTGFPKGVETPSSCNVAFCTIRGELFNLDENSRFLNAIPFFGNIGMSNMVLPMLDGGALVLTGARFDVKEVLGLIDKERITHTVFVPTMLIDILNHPDAGKYNLLSLKRIECSGAPVPQKLIQQVKDTLGISLNNAYGLSEAGGLSTWVPYGDTAEHVEKSVGIPLPNCELAIKDISTGENLPPKAVGEICTKEAFPGSQHMKGYYKRPDLTAECIKDGWLHSGDLGCMDEDNYVYITGRLKEMFTVGGFNVSPPEIEGFLLSHPDIANATVVGVPDERLGEVGAAFIIPKQGAKPTQEEIIAFCKKNINEIKVPRYVFFVNEFPLNPQGKVQKFKLKEKAVDDLGLKG
ncbi:MAG: Long-chain-fatty-acid--CoA ligase [Syntrophorhabdus sp. PtaU1.Bin050]|nr:MAG: Long-chain-fatty-acid--CoA ligase [Syntrophorhabdus sp. PtaU1.Bin050]